MSDEIQEIREAAEKHLESLKDTERVTVIFAKRMNGNWKIILRYSTKEDPYTDVMAMVLVDNADKEVKLFRDNITTY